MEIFGVYGFDTVFIILFAIFFYKVADIEGASRLLLAGLSLIVSFANRILGLGIPGLILGQAALFLAITLIRVWRSRKS
jgi:hypothetical protein